MGWFGKGAKGRKQTGKAKKSNQKKMYWPGETCILEPIITPSAPVVPGSDHVAESQLLDFHTLGMPDFHLVHTDLIESPDLTIAHPDIQPLPYIYNDFGNSDFCPADPFNPTDPNLFPVDPGVPDAPISPPEDFDWGVIAPPIDPTNPPPIVLPVDPPIDANPAVRFDFKKSDQPIVGVIDTGFNGNNPDIDYSNITLGRDYIDNDANPLLQNGEGNEHGTHILGVIAAKLDNGIGIDGINDKAPIWVSRATGSGKWADSLVEFVNHAKQSGQPNAVVNLSLDLTQVNPDGSVTTRYEFTPQERSALEYARQNHVLIVAAAGNDGGVMSVLGQASQEFDNIITVGSADGIQRADYSSFGAGLDILADGGTQENPVISTTGDGVGGMAGTSVAAANVTGAVSQVWAANLGLNYRQVIDILKSTATDLDTPGWDVETGAGLLNLVAAVDMAKATTPETYNPQSMLIPNTWGGDNQVTPTERAAAEQFSKNGKYYDWVSYQIKSGDSLSAIAQRTLGKSDYDYYMWIANHNKISNPSLIYAGQWIEIPKEVAAPKPNLDKTVGYDGSKVVTTFVNTFNRNGGKTVLGSPTNNVHFWNAGYIQDFSGGTEVKGAIMKSNANDNSYWVGGEFWKKYIEVGGSGGILGYPTSDRYSTNGGLRQDFLGGAILKSAKGIFPVFGGIGNHYLKNEGGEKGRLGFPVGGEVSVGNGVIHQYFENGYILYGDGPTRTIMNPPISKETVINSGGWWADYYSGDFKNYYGSEQLPGQTPWGDINKLWGEGGPVGLKDDFSVRLSGKRYLEPGRYHFHVMADDRSRVRINGQEIISAWYNGSFGQDGYFDSTGGYYDIEVDYKEDKGAAAIVLNWEALFVTIDGFRIDGDFYKIWQKHKDGLGNPISDVITDGSGNSYQQFENASIVKNKYGTFPLYGPIGQQYLQENGLGLVIGEPVDLGNGFIKQKFENGYIIWNGLKAVAYYTGKGTPTTDTPKSEPLPISLVGFDGKKIVATFVDTFKRNGDASVLGFPLNNVHKWENGYIQDFDWGSDGRGAIMKPNGTDKSYWVGGEIWKKFLELGGAKDIGYPTTDRIAIKGGLANLENGGGAVQEFTRGNLPTKIWQSKYGVFPTWGGIGAKYDSLGGANSFLGFPTSGEVAIGDGWIIQHFEGGYILYKKGMPTIAYDTKAVENLPPDSGHGSTSNWHAQYWNNKDLIGSPKWSQYEDEGELRFDAGSGAPVGTRGIPEDKFSARWITTSYFDGGIYNFINQADDGVRVYVDGKLIIDKWNNSPFETKTAYSSISPGYHQVMVEYFENTYSAANTLRWEQANPPNEWAGEFFRGKDLNPNNLAGYRSGGTGFLNKDWGNSHEGGVPIGNDSFSDRWTTTRYFDEPGVYEFTSIADDGVRVWVDDQLVIDQWKNQSAKTNKVLVPLDKGYHRIRVEHFEDKGAAANKLDWQKVAGKHEYLLSSDGGSSFIPNSWLEPWTGEYFNNRDLTGTPVVTRLEGTKPNTFANPDSAVWTGGLNFDWGNGSPDSRLNKDNFSARWTTHRYLPGGTYTFKVGSDDGVRLFVDGENVLDQWVNRGFKTDTVTVTLPEGIHNLQLEYFERTGAAAAKLDWDYSPDSSPYQLGMDSRGTVNTSFQASYDELVQQWGASAIGVPITALEQQLSNIGSSNPDLASPAVMTRLGTMQEFRGTQGRGALLQQLGSASVTFVFGKLWEAYQQAGGPNVLGYPLSSQKDLGNGAYELELPKGRLYWAPGMTNPTYYEYFKDSLTIPADSWRGEYFNNLNWAGNPVVVRGDSGSAGNLNEVWKASNPAPGVLADNFSVRWTTNRPFDRGTYRFIGEHDDGFKVEVNGQAPIDKLKEGATKTKGYATFTDGGQYPVQVKYQEYRGNATAKLNYEKASNFVIGLNSKNKPTQAIIDAFKRNGSYDKVGLPINDVHSWGNGVVQDMDKGSNGKGILMKRNGSDKAYYSYGNIWKVYANKGGPDKLGYPVSDVIRHSSNVSYQKFERGLIVTSKYGTYVIPDGFDDAFSNHKGISKVGVPINNVHTWGKGVVQDFDHGANGKGILMRRNGSNKVYYLYGKIREAYSKNGGATGWLGYPTSDRFKEGGLTRQNFEGGYIIWDGKSARAYRYSTGGGGKSLLQAVGPDYFLARPQFYTTGNIFWKSGYGSSLVAGGGQTEGNCTWYAWGRVKELGGNVDALNSMYGNANQWHNQLSHGARVIGDNESPQPGDIAQWTRNGQNHVAVVERVYTDANGVRRVVLSESHYRSNFDGGAAGTLHRIVDYRADNPDRYIRVPGVSVNSNDKPSNTNPSEQNPNNIISGYLPNLYPIPYMIENDINFLTMGPEYLGISWTFYAPDGTHVLTLNDTTLKSTITVEKPGNLQTALENLHWQELLGRQNALNKVRANISGTFNGSTLPISYEVKNDKIWVVYSIDKIQFKIDFFSGDFILNWPLTELTAFKNNGIKIKGTPSIEIQGNYRFHYEPVKEPEPIPAEETKPAVERIKNFVVDVINSGADAAQAVNKFLDQNPDLVNYVVGIALAGGLFYLASLVLSNGATGIFFPQFISILAVLILVAKQR